MQCLYKNSQVNIRPHLYVHPIYDKQAIINETAILIVMWMLDYEYNYDYFINCSLVQLCYCVFSI